MFLDFTFFATRAQSIRLIYNCQWLVRCNLDLYGIPSLPLFSNGRGIFYHSKHLYVSFKVDHDEIVREAMTSIVYAHDLSLLESGYSGTFISCHGGGVLECTQIIFFKAVLKPNLSTPG